MSMLNCDVFTSPESANKDSNTNTPVVNNTSVVPNVTNQVVQPQVSVVGMQNATSTPIVPIVNTQMPAIDKLGE